MTRSRRRPLASRGIQVKLLIQFVSPVRYKCAAHLFLFDLIAMGVTDQEVSGYALLSFLDISYTYLTNCMEQSPSWEAYRCSTSEEILSILLNSQVLYRTHEAATCLCPEPDESSPCPLTRIVTVHYRPIIILQEVYAHICVMFFTPQFQTLE
jgi:hypothetical protein